MTTTYIPVIMDLVDNIEVLIDLFFFIFIWIIVWLARSFSRVSKGLVFLTKQMDMVGSW